MPLPIHIALLELKRFLVSRGELGFSLALPVVLFALMYGAFGGEESFHTTAHMVDLDQGNHSRTLIDRLDAMEELTVRERTLEDADRALDRSAILTAIVIPSGFSAALENGDSAAITFRKRGNGGDSGSDSRGHRQIGRSSRWEARPVCDATVSDAHSAPRMQPTGQDRRGGRSADRGVTAATLSGSGDPMGRGRGVGPD